MSSSVTHKRLFQNTGTIKNQENVSCELRVCRRDKSKADTQGPWIKMQVYSAFLEDEW